MRNSQSIDVITATSMVNVRFSQFSPESCQPAIGLKYDAAGVSKVPKRSEPYQPRKCASQPD